MIRGRPRAASRSTHISQKSCRASGSSSHAPISAKAHSRVPSRCAACFSCHRPVKSCGARPLERGDAQLVVRREDVEAVLELVEAHAPVAVDVELREQRVGRVVDRRRVQRAQRRARRDDAPEVRQRARTPRRSRRRCGPSTRRAARPPRALLRSPRSGRAGRARRGARGERVRRRERLGDFGRLPELPPQLRGVGVLGRGVARPAPRRTRRPRPGPRPRRRPRATRRARGRSRAARRPSASFAAAR